MAFFRVPQFRAIFIEAVQIKSRPEAYNERIIEDNSKSLNVDDLVEHCLVHTMEDESLSKFFNWEAHCYDFID